eukprot:6175215-Pleurochrysis_carterae.AAC.2
MQGAYVRVGTRRRGVRSNSSVRACEHACEVCARSAVLRRRGARGMRRVAELEYGNPLDLRIVITRMRMEIGNLRVDVPLSFGYR